MKNLFCLLIAVASWGVIRAITEEDAMDALESYGDKCDPKPNKDNLKDIINNKEDVSNGTKCFRLCLMNQLEMLNDCKLDPENLKYITGMLFEDKDAETVEIANGCNAKVECEDECYAAHDYAMCILGEFKSRGWPLPEVEKED